MRDQLTSVLAGLYGDIPTRSVYSAEKEIDAIYKINGPKMSPQQRHLMREALFDLQFVSFNVQRFIESEKGDGPTGQSQDLQGKALDKNYKPPSYAEHEKHFHEAKQLIAQVASTF